MTRGPLRRGALAALAVLGVLAGCASLPTSGPVQRGVEAAPDSGGIVLVAEDPHPGDSAEQIVRGFLSASAAGLADDFMVARKFLLPEADWDPIGGVVIYSGSSPLEVVEPTEGTVEVRAQIAGTVDPDGVYADAPSGTDTELTYRLAQDADGQWRIVDLPDGVLVSDVVFGFQYRETPLYFLSPDATTLVPDVRWYPQRNTATHAMRGLLGGTVEWLAPGVISAIPNGTTLDPDVVTVSEGRAIVPLSENVLAAGQTDRARLRAQVVATLTALPQVQTVEIDVDGVSLTISGADPELRRDPPVGTTPVMIADDVLVGFNGTSLVEVPDTEPLTGFDASHVALPYGDDLAVMLSGDNALVTVPTPSAASVTLLQDGALLPPSFDRQGWVWTGPLAGTGQLLVARTDGSTGTVEAPALEDADVVAIRVSRDGTRLATISVQAGATRVQVASVVRDPDGKPVRLGESLTVGASLTSASDVVWVDESTLGILGVSQTSRTVHLTTVGGPTQALPTVEGAVAVASGRGDRQLYVATADGGLYARSGIGWRRVAGDIAGPTFPG